MKQEGEESKVTSGTTSNSRSSPRTLEAARHLCQEVRVVLTSLRAGPPNVARGELAQDLMDLRSLIKHEVSSNAAATMTATAATTTTSLLPNGVMATQSPPPPPQFDNPVTSSSPAISIPSTMTKHSKQQQELEEEDDGAVLVQLRDAESRTSSHGIASETDDPRIRGGANDGKQRPSTSNDVGPYARPFLAVVMDPRAAGPHTLVALRALHRLLESASLAQAGSNHHRFTVALEPITKGVLSCKFEQTDAGADEAVEMAIADLLALLVNIDRRAIQTETLMDAFNTVFITRNTFVHSPALCYHFEDVLTTMVKAVFSDLDNLRDPDAGLILEFLVNQLLHTPLVGGDDEASRDAQIAHDATRVLCLRLTRYALCKGFRDADEELLENAAESSSDLDRSLLHIVQDDLCLSLLMTGQAIWAYQDNSNVSPGFISLEVLSEICATLSALWTTVSLRKFLVPQFESIFAGFYQRALVLLRKRVNPTDSNTFHANLVFDAGVEVILESLVDVMCLHDHQQTVAQGNGGALETLFASYDCSIKRSDVAVGLMVELCRCCGSKVDEEGDFLETQIQMPSQLTTNHSSSQTASATSMPADQPKNAPTDAGDSTTELLPVDPWRQVPPHLKELCAEAIIGGMKCLFRDDHPSEKTRDERRSRKTILVGHVDEAPKSFSGLSQIHGAHHLRDLKSQKRLMRRAARLFNEKASKGISFLLSSGIVSEPVTPRSVASFLRNGIVVGLDKRAVGAYLGEVGKSPVAGKSPPNWERDWFHKEVLSTYCSLFRFERQSLLDGLRMFLAAFRLPGEAQQIDRILQAFSDSCGQICDESANGTLKLFSEDPKRASDAAYLLSFSIIMLNTDQHNDNIREDRKMSKDAFVRNNTDYGRDITEPGKELPREYLEAIYDSIREEEIRTEGEGADGSMTVERWKDVLRGSAGEEGQVHALPTVHDAEDLTELVLEHVWKPIMSAVGSLWGVSGGNDSSMVVAASSEPVPTGMLGAQGARLGMDMALDMLIGVRQLGRKDIFCKIFDCVCRFTGLLSYASNVADRTWTFSNSVEAQSAVVVALRVARDASDEIGVDGWRHVWSLLFELRDLKMLGGGVASRGRSILMESDPDLLRDEARRDWTMKLIKGGLDAEIMKAEGSGVTSMFGAMGRALFGSVDEATVADAGRKRSVRTQVKRTVHGKEDHVVWDELAPSDDEDETNRNNPDESALSIPVNSRLSAGATFESQLIHEDLLLHQQREMPVTGLERVDDTNTPNISPRARVRKRLLQACDFAGLVSESRFMYEDGIGNLLQALIDLIPTADPSTSNAGEGETKEANDVAPSASEVAVSKGMPPLSPASEGFAEVLICEIALRNRDRLSLLWHNYLRSHYVSRMQRIAAKFMENEMDLLTVITGGMEKCVTGLLRISCCAAQRGEIANDILATWKILESAKSSPNRRPLVCVLDRHLGEGLWRIIRNVDDTSQLKEEGWAGLLALIHWCSDRGAQLHAILANGIGRQVGLAEDDPALQAYRSLHFLLNASEVRDLVPHGVVKSIRALVAAGELRNCHKLSIAALDLLHVVNSQVEKSADENRGQEKRDLFWQTCWRPVIEAMAEASEISRSSNVRQHSLSMLADSFLDKRGGYIPVNYLCSALGELCIPLAGRRILALREGSVSVEDFDELMIELELCISLIFKPLRHHLKNVVNKDRVVLLSLWKPVLDVLKELLRNPNADVEASGFEQKREMTSDKVLKATNELTIEHLRNVIMVLIDFGILKAEPHSPGDITALTWESVGKMDSCKIFLEEWKQAASQAVVES